MNAHVSQPFTYEDRLSSDLNWAMNEGGLFFSGQSAVHQTLRKVTRRLEELGVPYAVADGMALFAHGYRRFTEDVDILVSTDAEIARRFDMLNEDEYWGLDKRGSDQGETHKD